MDKFTSKNLDIVYKQKRIVRVICYFKNKGYSVGTGFLVNNGKSILTCWHVVCGVDLKVMLKSELFLQSTKQTESEKVSDYYSKIADRIEVELCSGKKITVRLDSYDYYYDLAILKISEDTMSLPFFELELKDTLDYADQILFPGYPRCFGYDLFTSPFAANSGNVSSFPTTEISGGKFRMVQLAGICIGGNSGAPIFKGKSNKVIGILNGYEWRGLDGIAIFKDSSFLETKNFQVPINISYATEFNFLSKNSHTFKKLLRVMKP